MAANFKSTRTVCSFQEFLASAKKLHTTISLKTEGLLIRSVKSSVHNDTDALSFIFLYKKNAYEANSFSSKVHSKFQLKPTPHNKQKTRNKTPNTITIKQNIITILFLWVTPPRNGKISINFKDKKRKRRKQMSKAATRI